MARFSGRQQWVLRQLLRNRGLTTREIGRKTTVPLSRMALIIREEPVQMGPVQPDDRWRLTHTGKLIAASLFQPRRRLTHAKTCAARPKAER